MSRKSRKRHSHLFRRRTDPGAPPGSVIVDPAANPPSIQAIAYGPDQFEERSIDDAAQAASFVGKFPVVWINIDGLGDARTIEEIGRIFHLHPLALEDVVNVHQRAKVDEYGDHLFIVARMADMNARFHSEQISFFLGKGFVITFQEDPGDCWGAVRERLRRKSGRMRALGPDYLVYALIDSILDGYYPLLDRYEERLDELDESIGAPNAAGISRELHEVRTDLRQMRRAISPHRDAVGELIRGDDEIFSHETRLHLRDCYDHTIQIIDAVDIYREMCSDLRELLLTKMSARVNDVMKVLTIFSTLFIPLTFIVGVYGMNFDHMPELHWRYSYPVLWGIMILIGAIMFYFFYRRGWLTQQSDEPDVSH